MDGVDYDEKLDSPGQHMLMQLKQQDSPGLQIIKLEHGSSQDCNIPHSSHSSSAKKSPNGNPQGMPSTFRLAGEPERTGCYIQPHNRDQDTFKINVSIRSYNNLQPYLISQNKYQGTNASATPNQMKMQSSFSLINHKPLYKQSSYSSFMKAQSSQVTQHNSMIKRPPSHQKK